MFEMSTDEFEIWRSQFVNSKNDRGGMRYKPFCFTEQGVTMLSCILNSRKAIAVRASISKHRRYSGSIRSLKATAKPASTIKRKNRLPAERRKIKTLRSQFVTSKIYSLLNSSNNPVSLFFRTLLASKYLPFMAT